MPITSYFTMNGEIVGEQTTGSPQLDYVPDALGSVIATTDQNQVVQYSARYKPYGDTLISTGTVPRFTWVGGPGYLASAGQPYGQFSVRDRFYSAAEGCWVSVDSFWPSAAAYGYATQNPATKSDPSGDDPGGCSSLVDMQIQPKICDIIANYLCSKCKKCDCDVQLNAKGTVTFTLKVYTFIPGSNPCVETSPVSCSKGGHYSLPCPPGTGGACNRPTPKCTYNYKSYYSDPGPVSGTFNGTGYTITNISFKGRINATISGKSCSPVGIKPPSTTFLVTNDF